MADALLLLVVMNTGPLLFGTALIPVHFQALVAAVFFVVAPAHLASEPHTLKRWRRLVPAYLASSTIALLCSRYYLANALPWWALVAWVASGFLARVIVFQRAQVLGWMSRQHIHCALGQISIFLFFCLGASRWTGLPPPNWELAAAIAIGWVVAHRLVHLRGATLRSVVVPTVVLAFAFGCAWFWSTRSVAPVQLSFTAWLAALLSLFGVAAARTERQIGAAAAGEILRWIGLFAAPILLLLPFFRPGPAGAGDSVYYTTVLADAMQQFRNGVFPVFNGQSIFQFNGAAFPIRVAPGIVYLGGLVDLLTGRTLGPFSILKILIVATGEIGIFATYWAMRRYAVPPFIACVLALLFISCPGVIGLVYNGDLYMSWLAMPWMLVAFSAGLLSFQGGSTLLYSVLGFSVGMTWWMHTPIAMWTTLVLAAVEVGRFARARPSCPMYKLSLGATSFFLTALYPLISVLKYTPDPQAGSSDVYKVPAANIAYMVSEAFPTGWLIISKTARLASDHQLGLSLMALSIVTAAVAVRKRRVEGIAIGAIMLGLWLLLLPIPFLNLKLWGLVPMAVRAATNVWPMQRLYLLLAGLTVFFVVLSWERMPFLRSRIVVALLLVGGIWSFVQAFRLQQPAWDVGDQQSEPAALSPESLALTRYSYVFFSKPPAYFTHGVTDPVLENRILSPDFSTVKDGGVEAALHAAHLAHAPESEYTFVAVAGHLETSQPVVLEPGKYYIATFILPGDRPLRGTLVVKGPTLRRVYGLPEYGEAKSFGLGGKHVPSFPLNTSQKSPEKLQVLLDVPAAEYAGSPPHLRIAEYPRSQLPIQIQSWIPYQSVVRSGNKGWLETPRMYQPYYRASVDGHSVEIRRSPNNLVAVRIPSGTSEVRVWFAPPTGLQLSFWISALAIIVGIATLIRWISAVHATEHAG